MKNQSYLTIFILLCFVLISNCFLIAEESCSRSTDVSLQSFNTSWFENPQVYNMVAFAPEDIEKYHITVNGLWNGFIGEDASSPFALGRLIESVYSKRTYESDKEFVDTQHDQGMLVPGTILTIQGHRSLQQDSFEEFASRSLNGKLCPWDEEADSYWMNTLHPGFIEWCIQHGKKAIDAGADIIVLDEIQGNSFIPLYQWSSQYTGIPAPGFSNETIEGFRYYLFETFDERELLEIYGIADLETVNLKNRIAETMNLTYIDRITVDSLIEEYQKFLEKSNFEAKKQLIHALRTYAKNKNQNIVISANSYALGTHQPFDFWSKGLLFAELIDLFTFENTYTAINDPTIPDFHRSKWLAWERLAYAATEAPAVTLIDTNTLRAVNEYVFPLFGFSNSLGILCAEAYANKGSFVNYHFPLFNREQNWKDVSQIHNFVMNNKELYDYTAESYGNIGILFLYSEGMRTHMNTYLGCAQALAEAHYPFTILFDGDDNYINSTLSPSDLKEFPIIVVPSLIQVTEKQKSIIKDYVEHGGIAIAFDESALGFLNGSGQQPYGEGLFYIFDENVGKKYFETYEMSYQQKLIDCINNYIDSYLSISSNNRKIIATPYYQVDGQQLIIHVINYDHIGFFDFIWPHSNINIQIKKPNFQIESVTLKNIDGASNTLHFNVKDGMINFTIPKLKDYTVIVIK